mmetsp:Transcript_11989/g.22178  ORF Transcript_11989/g.22178 Transcript_11989/m.22178 type:complete len:540 (+) Transcript_11989:169-1788(+)
MNKDNEKVSDVICTLEDTTLSNKEEDDISRSQAFSTGIEICDEDYPNEVVVRSPRKSRPGPFESTGGSVYGHVAEGWERVRQAFTENFELNLERGAQLTIYHQSKLVVDLHGNGNCAAESIFKTMLSRTKEKDVYNGNTIQNMYSSGKNMEVVCIAVLVDRGLLAYTDLVIKHWPEFGQFGKNDITIADVLRHEAGVPFFTDPLVMQKRSKDRQLTKQDVDNVEVLDRIIEASGKCYNYGRRHYHACTRGWIISGIIRRVDEQKRTFGQFMREEICIPLNLNIYCGIPRDMQKVLNIANIIPLDSKNTMWQVAPALVGQSSDRTLKGILNTFSDLHHPLLRHNIGNWIIPDIHCKVTNSVEGREMEFPSANVHGNARSVAIVNNIFATGGLVPMEVPCGPGGRMKRVVRRFISAETVAKAFAEPITAHDVFLNSDTCFTQGGFAQMSEMRSTIVLPDFHETFDGFWGWGGVGGSWSLWNPVEEVSFSYMMNGRSLHPIGGPRGDRIMSAVQEVLKTFARKKSMEASGEPKASLSRGGGV